MPNLVEEACTQRLGPYYRDRGFILYEEGDHTLVLEHTTCGFTDKFNATSARIEAIRNDCDDHLSKCRPWRGNED